IAIMAVLIGVLAPQFLRYVERSRLQKDNQSVAEIASAAKAALANESIYEGLGTAGTSVAPAGGTGTTYTFSAPVAGNPATFQTELASTVGTQVVLSSKAYKSVNAPTINVSVDTSTGTVTVSTTGYVENVGEGTTTKIF
ncbi:MAG: hypothetical protein K5795_07950, partial [Lachnospiraceae bacterium]|nr:hypothetical protein [Lachnospiraceae bacterium]